MRAGAKLPVLRFIILRIKRVHSRELPDEVYALRYCAYVSAQAVAECKA